MAPSNETHCHSAGQNGKNHMFLTDASQDLLSQAGRIIPDLRTIQKLGQTVVNGGLVDDRKYLVENIIQVTASLPNTSGLRGKITDAFVSTLWDNLQHPPLSYLGDQFKYRTADGSYNNIMYPHLGASGSHYARTVTPQHPRPAVLPDPSLIFDTLLARDGPAKEHPSQISSNLFYLATVIIHDLFHTDERDGTKLKNSSYLDLGPLYGHNQDEQNKVRSFTDGLLKPDTFAEKRLLTQPPGVCALLVAFSRFHNWVVGELAYINEAGRFSLPTGMKQDDPRYSGAVTKRDNDLFQTGRLITCGLYVNIILNDYLRTILNLNENPTESDWTLDPRKSLEVFDKGGVPRGVGNQVSAEFNMIYRWHAAISNQDEAWANRLCHRIFGPEVDGSTLSVNRFLEGLRKYFENNVPGEPATWTFGGLERQQDGRFADGELVGLLSEGCENVAGAFGARNIPKVMRAIEILGIEQGRQWELATLNEFRVVFKLKPHSTFLEVNSNPAIAEALEALYGHPDNIELYVGVQAEEAKKPFYPGSGLCPGFTISAAILSDAVALVRGDRFYTVDYSPTNLTNFGFDASSSDFDVAGGGVMYKLLMRAFPGWYQPNSVYALYPFVTPEKSCEIMDKYMAFKDLNFDRPSYTPPPVPVTTWEGATKVLEDQKRFHVPWRAHTFQITRHDYMLSGDSTANADQRRLVNECLYEPKTILEDVQKLYESITTDLLHEKSFKLRDCYHVDIVRDVGNLAHAYFCSQFFSIPLKDCKDLSAEAYTPRELSDALALLFGYVFLDLEPADSLKNRTAAATEAQRMGAIVAKSASNARDTVVRRFMQALGRSEAGAARYGPQLVNRLLREGMSVDEVVWTIIPTAAAACATQAQGWAQMLDLYLSEKYASHWPAIQKLARSTDPGAFEKLKKYALEGFRLSTPAFGVLRTAVDEATIKDGEISTTVQKGHGVFVDFITAGRDPVRFPDPEEIRLDRPADVYIHHGWGPHACLGRAIVTTAGAVLLGVLGRLENIRRAPGPAGEMKSKLVNGAFKLYLREDGSSWTPFPQIALAIFWIFPTGVHIAFIAVFTFSTMVIVRVLNGPPTGRSLIGIPRNRDPVNDETEPWFFINGIATGKHWHQSNLTALADTFGRQIVGIHNPTKGVILDLVECLIQRDLDYKTADIRQGRAQLRAALAASTTKKVVLIVHSQGGIIASSIIDWLYGELSESQIQKLEIYTFGIAARQFRNPPLHEPQDSDPAGNIPRRQIQGERAIRNIEHYANRQDFFANIGVLQFTAPAGAYSNASVFSGTVFVREGSGHLFNMHYLDPIFGEDSSFMESMVDVRPGDGPGKPVSMRIREFSRLYKYKNGENPEEQDAK
ncbi:psi-producing oxygenase A [Aspergillus udagawae]|uniref:Psi-producing oxygenase A n=1 Tax=Aspergillus udagawae TaxID=91492 RepID=A0ABQ1AU03_9EURO|nr:psi-producing oxygenase A [Aspergillus udagawae]GFG10270.1 psi-producing oxygenase A [Aspergillus udagawae]